MLTRIVYSKLALKKSYYFRRHDSPDGNIVADWANFNPKPPAEGL